MTLQTLIITLAALTFFNPFSGKKDDAAKSKPESAGGWQLYLSQGACEEGTKCWKKAIEKNERDALARLGLAELAEDADRPTQAIEEYFIAFDGFVRRLTGEKRKGDEEDPLLLPGARYTLHRLYALREFREREAVFTSETLKDLIERGAPASVADLYRYYLLRSLIEAGRWEDALDVREGLRFAREYLLLGPFPND
jgi:hypothetical protein